MRVYHRTDAADAILAHGFRDAEGSYLSEGLHRGVWVADEPLDANEGANGEQLLVIDVPEEVVREYEWAEERKPYREFLVPAAVLNGYDVRPDGGDA